MTAREAVLRALRSGRPEGVDLPEGAPPAEAASYRQTLRTDAVRTFCGRAEELGVRVHRPGAPEALLAVLTEVCRDRRVYVEPALGWLAPALERAGARVVRWENLPEAEVGITVADYGLAETGTLVLLAAPERPRSGSLLPPVHVAVLPEDRVLGDLFDLWEWVDDLPSALTLVTGPSRSADIEMSLAVGVHGPGTVHVVLVSAGLLEEATRAPAK